MVHVAEVAALLVVLGTATRPGAAVASVDVTCDLVDVHVMAAGNRSSEYLTCVADKGETYLVDSEELQAAGWDRSSRRVSVRGAGLVGPYALGLKGRREAVISSKANSVVQTLRRTGTSCVLVLRVRSRDATPELSAAVLARRWFGGSDDAVNLASQYLACSNGQLTFEPCEGKGVEDGVLEVYVNRDIVGEDSNSVENWVLDAAEAELGETLASVVDHVAYVFPYGVVSGAAGRSWIAYGQIGGSRSVYNDDWAASVSVQVHELGHNLELMHSGYDGSEYGDRSGMMGSSYSSSDWPQMCFNAAKSYDLGWYPTADYDPSDASDGALFSLSGVGDVASPDVTTVVQVRRGSRTWYDYYVGYNRASGAHVDTNLFANYVLVTLAGDVGERTTSTLVAALKAGETFRATNFAGSGDTLEVTFCRVRNDDGGGAVVAEVSVHLDADSRTAKCFEASEPTREPTRAPTLDPTTSPSTWRPSRDPTVRPSYRPSYLPTLAPTTLDPTRRPSYAPTSYPPSPAPTTETSSPAPTTYYMPTPDPTPNPTGLV